MHMRARLARFEEPTLVTALATVFVMLFVLVSVAQCEDPAPNDEADDGTGADGADEAGEADEAGDVEMLIDGFEVPESVLHDTEADVYLVSNIDGRPNAVDDNGFISRVDPDGTIAELRWIDGADDAVELSAPKGMGIVADRLYVTDITAIRVFSRSTGEPIESYDVDGARFLNDITTDADGNIYVSDSADTRIHKLSSEGELSVFTDEIQQPNGLLVVGEALHCVTGAGRLARFDLDGAKQQDVAGPSAGLDGLIRASDGTFYCSSWAKQAVYAIDWADAADEISFESAIEDLNAPADIGYDASRNRLLVPHFNDGKIRIHPMSD